MKKDQVTIGSIYKVRVSGGIAEDPRGAVLDGTEVGGRSGEHRARVELDALVVSPLSSRASSSLSRPSKSARTASGPGAGSDRRSGPPTPSSSAPAVGGEASGGLGDGVLLIKSDAPRAVATVGVHADDGDRQRIDTGPQWFGEVLEQDQPVHARLGD